MLAFTINMRFKVEKCRNCGYIHKGAEAPEECPACAYPQSYYELMVENLMVAVLTVSYHSLKAALANPIDSLRYE